MMGPDLLQAALDQASVILQSDPNWLDFWENGEWLNGAIQPYIHLLGRATLLLLLGAPLTIAMWVQTEDLVIPGIILSLFMGLLLSGAPAGATIAGYVVVLLATMLAYRSITGVGR